MSELIPIEGEKWRYHCTSESDPSMLFLVDLQAFSGLGQCSCQDWEFRRQPKVTALSPKEVSNLSDLEKDFIRCKHIRKARVDIGMLVLDELIEQENIKDRERRHSQTAANHPR